MLYRTCEPQELSIYIVICLCWELEIQIENENHRILMQEQLTDNAEE